MVLSKRDFPPLPSQKRSKNRPKSKQGPQKSKTSSSCVSIDDLPDELIIQILDYLPGIDYDHFQLSALVSLSVTSRRFHRMVNERLYAVFDSTFCIPYLFLRTMMENSRAAAMVRKMKITYTSGSIPAQQFLDLPHDKDEDQYTPTNSDRKIVKQGFKALDIPDWKIWAQDCNTEDVDPDTLYTAIIMYTPNLTTLEVHDGVMPGNQGPKWIDFLKRAVNGKPPGHTHQFTNLSSVYINIVNLRLKQLAPLFRLQSLLKLTLRGLFEAGEAADGTAFFLGRLIPTLSSPTEELNLQLSFVHIDILDLLIGSVKTLKKFQYDHSTENTPDDDYGNSIPSDMELFTSSLSPDATLGSRLVRHQKTLQSLELYFSILHDGLMYREHFRNNLSDLSVLEHLECPIGVLMDVKSGSDFTLAQYLPRSLHSLSLILQWINDEWPCLAALQHLASYCRPNLPVLSSVYVGIEFAEEFRRCDWELVQTRFSGMGIEFSFRHVFKASDGFTEWEDDSSGLSESSESSDEVALYSSEDEQ